jgi:hypothetical protein
MEIVEVVTFHLNKLEEVLEVSFRTNSDSEDVIRDAKIPFIDISDFGYNFHDENNFELLEEEDDDYFDEFEDDDLLVDENEVISFLNEYYVLFIDKLPKAEFF